MTVNTPHSKLPTDTQAALARIKAHICAFDRITIWLDHPAPDLPVKQIKAHCGKPPLISDGKSHRHHPLWQCEMSLFQPTEPALQIVRDALVGIISKVTYVELASDWITGSRDDALELQHYFLRHLRITNIRQPVKFDTETAYFNRRASKQRERCNINAALYADKPSKFTSGSRACCHLEYRLSGMSACRGVGLNTVADCASFEHSDFWSRHLTLFDFSSKVALGKIVAPKPEVSDVALRKHAKQFLLANSYEGRYILQNCVLSNRKVLRALHPIDHRHFLQMSTRTKTYK
jgi:hypothetical protein